MPPCHGSFVLLCFERPAKSQFEGRLADDVSGFSDSYRKIKNVKVWEISLFAFFAQVVRRMMTTIISVH